MASADCAKISEILERQGSEIVITSKSAGSVHEIKNKEQSALQWRSLDWIHYAHDQAALSGITVGLFPVWDLKKRESVSLFFAPFSGQDRARLNLRQILSGASEGKIAETEIALLHGAGAYAHRVHAAHKLCAVGVGVSYETLSSLHSRIRYIDALKTMQTVPTCPLLLRIEQVPTGTPMGRLAEIITMLGMPNVRITLAFETLRQLPDFDIRLGVAGLGGSLRNSDSSVAAVLVGKLARRAAEQRAFVFLHDIDREDCLSVATQNGVRFGSGKAIGADHCYNGQEAIPDLPLRC